MTSPDAKLAEFRARIDATDDAISRLLLERIEIIRQVAVLKAAHWPKACHIKPGREGQMHRAIAARFSNTHFPPLMALAIWRQLIGGSTHVESPLNVSYLLEYPEHRFFAREYFGVQIGSHSATSLADAIAHIRSGKANILVLPNPRIHEWWRETAALSAAGLKIFAALPVVETNTPSDCAPAVALAAVTPEDSGDDVSYFVHQGKLIVADEFVTAHNDAEFLGAHPRPIRLPIGA